MKRRKRRFSGGAARSKGTSVVEATNKTVHLGRPQSLEDVLPIPRSLLILVLERMVV